MGDRPPRLGHDPSEEKGWLRAGPGGGSAGTGPSGARVGLAAALCPRPRCCRRGVGDRDGARGAALPAPCPAAARRGLPVSRHGGAATASVPGLLALRRLGNARGVPAGCPRGCLTRSGGAGRCSHGTARAAGSAVPLPLGWNGSCCRLACGRAFSNE